MQLATLWFFTLSVSLMARNVAVFLIFAGLGCYSEEKPREHNNDMFKIPTVSTVDVSDNDKYKRKIVLAGRFDEPPDVTVCPGAPITEQRLKQGLDFWRALGYSFGKVTFKSTATLCTSEWGAITFRLPTQEELSASVSRSHLATTKRYALTADPTYLVKSEVFFQNTYVSKKKYIVEHELGHAIGWLHSRKKGHIMYPELAGSGPNTTNVDWQDYQSAF